MHTKTILLVDDNAVQAAVRQTILKRHGCTVIAALDPREVLDQLRNSELPAEIHLVITDHIMPGMSGSAFVQATRELRPGVPVLVISGLEEAREEYESLRVAFLTKPVQPERLLECVRELVGLQAEILPVAPIPSPATA